MKKLSFIFSIAFLVTMFACEMPSDIESDMDDLDNTVLLTIDADGNSATVTFDRSTLTKPKSLQAKRPDVMVKGHMEWFPKESEASWKKSVNANGNATSGSGQVEVKSTAWGDVHGSVLCAYADGNEALVAMYITNARETLNPVYTEGKIVWFRLIDNGEGSNDPADQHYNTAYYTPQEFETIEDAQEFIANEISCETLYGNNWGFANDISEGNFQVM